MLSAIVTSNCATFGFKCAYLTSLCIAWYVSQQVSTEWQDRYQKQYWYHKIHEISDCLSRVVSKFNSTCAVCSIRVIWEHWTCTLYSKYQQICTHAVCSIVILTWGTQDQAVLSDSTSSSDPHQCLPSTCYNKLYLMWWDITSLPQGSTITPDLARPLPNILRRLFSWYGLNMVVGLRSILYYNGMLFFYQNRN